MPAVVKAVREKNKDALVIVDNTFLSPWNMRPIDYGVDIVLHSDVDHVTRCTYHSATGTSHGGHGNPLKKGDRFSIGTHLLLGNL